MLAVAATLKSQGFDWEAWFEAATFDSNSSDLQAIHNVNNAQALKSAAVLYRQTGEEHLKQKSIARVAALDDHCGLPTGMCALRSQRNSPQHHLAPPMHQSTPLSQHHQFLLLCEWCCFAGSAGAGTLATS